MESTTTTEMLHFSLLFIISMFGYAMCETETENVYLNSYESCGGKIMFEVSLKKEYVILPDVAADIKSHSFRDCEVTFHSHREHGHICLLQTGKTGRISDENAQLEARDGLGDTDDPVIKILKPRDNWTVREYCSNTPYITLYLKEIQKQRGADIREVDIQFRVVDIGSKARQLSLDEPYCNKDYKLLNSVVTLFNRPQFPGMAVTKLTSECGFQFNRIGGQRNTSICFAYVPSEKVDCRSHWKFALSSAPYSFDEKYFVYRLSCSEPRAQKMHVWCAEPTLSDITVVYNRSKNILSNSSIEHSGMFQYIVKDHKGSEQSFLEEVEEMFAKDDASSALPNWVIYLAVCVGVLMLVLLVVICYRRRMRYKPVGRSEHSVAI